MGTLNVVRPKGAANSQLIGIEAPLGLANSGLPWSQAAAVSVNSTNNADFRGYGRIENRNMYYHGEVSRLYNTLTENYSGWGNAYTFGSSFGENNQSVGLYGVMSEAFVAREISQLQGLRMQDSYSTVYANDTYSHFDAQTGLSSLARAGMEGGENLGTVDIAQLLADAPNAFQIDKKGRITLSQSIIDETLRVGGTVFNTRGASFAGDINKQLEDFRVFSYDKLADNPMAMLYDQGNQQGLIATRESFTTNIAVGRLKDGKLFTEATEYLDVYDNFNSSSNAFLGQSNSAAYVATADYYMTDARRNTDKFQYGIVGIPYEVTKGLRLPNIYQLMNVGVQQGTQLWSRVDKQDFADDFVPNQRNLNTGASQSLDSITKPKRNLLTGVIDRSLGG